MVPRSHLQNFSDCSNGRGDGFAAIDAMVALTILATMVILALGAAQTAGRIAAAAAETHRAKGELRYLLDNAPHAVGQVSGQSAEFSWQVRTVPDHGPRAGSAQICERTATVRGAASGRAYALSTAEVCPAL